MLMCGRGGASGPNARPCAIGILALALAGGVHAQGRVDLNQASAEEIERALVGIGPAKAAAIVADRQRRGPFMSLEALARVKGIGLRTVEKNLGRMQIGAAPAPGAATVAEPSTGIALPACRDAPAPPGR